MKTNAVLFALAMLVSSPVIAEETDTVDMTKIKCVVSGKAIDTEAFSEHHEGKVYFCCENCKAAFDKEGGKKKFAAKANHQLVATHQAKQKGCPMSGKAVDAEQTVEVAGVKVGFCCGNCQGAAEKKDEDARIKLVFNEKAFAKAFEMVKQD